MLFKDFFDPHNVDHIAEYGYLRIRGHWRKGFIPADVEVTGNFHIECMDALSMAWVHATFSDAKLRKIADKMDAEDPTEGDTHE